MGLTLRCVEGGDTLSRVAERNLTPGRIGHSRDIEETSVIVYCIRETNISDSAPTHNNAEPQSNKPVGDWISAPSPNFVAMATRVGPTIFCHGSIESAIPENPMVGPNIFGLSAIQGDL